MLSSPSSRTHHQSPPKPSSPRTPTPSKRRFQALVHTLRSPPSPSNTPNINTVPSAVATAPASTFATPPRKPGDRWKPLPPLPLQPQLRQSSNQSRPLTPDPRSFSQPRRAAAPTTPPIAEESSSPLGLAAGGAEREGVAAATGAEECSSSGSSGDTVPLFMQESERVMGHALEREESSGSLLSGESRAWWAMAGKKVAVEEEPAKDMLVAVEGLRGFVELADRVADGEERDDRRADKVRYAARLVERAVDICEGCGMG